jgi:hypothetical protein
MIATFMGTSSPALYRTPEIVLNLKDIGGKPPPAQPHGFETTLRVSSP